MAGWMNVDDDDVSSMRRCKGVLNDECLSSDEGSNELENTFVNLVSVFLKGTCPSDCYRPLPPMLGNGHSVDLLKLYSVVKEKGGFDAISENGLWNEVGLLYGLGPGLGSAIKLIYLKYLGALESWLGKLPKDKGLKGGWSRNGVISEAALVDLEMEYDSFMLKANDEMRTSDGCYILKVERSDVNFVDLTGEKIGNEKFKRKKIDMTFADVVDLTEEDDGNTKVKRTKIGMNVVNGVEFTKDDSDSLKFKLKKLNMSPANAVDLTNCCGKLKPKKLEMSPAKAVDLTQENRVHEKLERKENDMNANSVCRSSAVGPQSADNAIKRSENSHALKKQSTEVATSPAKAVELSKENHVHDNSKRRKSKMRPADFDSDSKALKKRSTEASISPAKSVELMEENHVHEKSERRKSTVGSADANSICSSSYVGSQSADDAIKHSENSNAFNKPSTEAVISPAKSMELMEENHVHEKLERKSKVRSAGANSVCSSTFVGSQLADDAIKHSESSNALKKRSTEAAISPPKSVELMEENHVHEKLERRKSKARSADANSVCSSTLVGPQLADNAVKHSEQSNAPKKRSTEAEMSPANDVDLMKENHVHENSEKRKSEMRSADVNSVCQSSVVGPQLADDAVKHSVNSNALKKRSTEAETSPANAVGMKENHVHENSERRKSEIRSADANSVCRSSLVSPQLADNAVKHSEHSKALKKRTTEVEESMRNADSSLLKDKVSRPEKNLDALSRMLLWMAGVAKDPTDPVIGSIPESSRWALHGNDNCWKQVLLARAALFLKKDHLSSTSEIFSQRKQKIHPSMFDDHTETAERPRSSPRILGAKLPNLSTPCGTHADRTRPRQRLEARLDLQPTASIYTCRPLQRIPIGQLYQAEISEWTGVAAESDSKWLGTRVWPLENKRANNLLIERDPIGKGRVDSCGCQFRGSIECVKFHTSERRKKMKIELGPAFYTWNFDKMGEECRNSWTAEEENKFKAVVKENPLSLVKFFWPELKAALPRKSWGDLVNYYFNVFMLRRRGSQNRFAHSNIDSDDDETEYRSVTNR